MCVPLSELIGMYFLCYCQLNGHRVVVHDVVVAIVVASVRAVMKIMGYGLENTRVLFPRGGPVSRTRSFHCCSNRGIVRVLLLVLICFFLTHPPTRSE